MRILVTRPSDEAERTASALARMGHTPLLAPMLLIQPVDVSIGEGPWAGILFTSGNAVGALADYRERDTLLALSAFTVGKRTERAARNAGFKSVIAASGDAAGLVRLIRARERESAPYLYLAGSDRAHDIGAELVAHGVAVETVIAYRAEPAASFPPAIAEAIERKEVDGVLHYSRRTAAAFCACAHAAGVIEAVRETAHYSLSARAAEPLIAEGVKDVRVAERPDEGALLALLPLTDDNLLPR
jgi:uroporphyrinogen-III synthase